jgi:hypothetical protein
MAARTGLTVISSLSVKTFAKRDHVRGADQLDAPASVALLWANR